MAEINIDAALIRNGTAVSQTDGEIVQLQNGCICCSLRADLLREVARLAQLPETRFDFLLIESSGISEPMQVAETFTVSLDELEQQLQLAADGDADQPEVKRAKADDEQIVAQVRSLKALARLDTCVTVVDAATFFDTFTDARALSEQYGDAIDDEDERNIVELLIDQIEFANVIVVNKCDLVAPETLDRVVAVVAKLNPSARLVKATRSSVPLDLVLNTGLFDEEAAAQQAGWLASLREPIAPETLEYGVGSVVYRRRRPFHPTRFHELVTTLFCVEEVGVAAAADDEDDDDGESASDQEGTADDFKRELERLRKEVVAAKQASPFAGVLRSKGFLWLGSKEKDPLLGFWSSAGTIASIGPEGKWFVDTPECDWPPCDHAAIRADIGAHPHGDRRIEIVFIGIAIDQAKLFALLDSCLCTDAEMAALADPVDDPFASWQEDDEGDE